MSASLDLFFALYTVLTTVLISSIMWNIGAGLVVIFILLVGVMIGHFISARRKPAKVLPVFDGAAESKANETLNAPASALLEATMNGMREGVLVVDRNLSVVAFNPAARLIFNRVAGALERRRLSELTRNASVHAAFGAVIADGVRGEVKVELHDTERRVFDLSIVPLHLGGGKSPHGAIGVFFDITQLERLERVRQEFLSNVSHELRTPLTSIIAFVETLQEGATDDAETRARFLSVIRKNAARMHNLIDDILELSAIEAGTVTIEMTNVRLHQLVAEIIASLAANASARGVTMRNEVCADAFVRADTRRLEQMLINLISNAIKFNREGGTVTISHQASDGRDRITVTDTGEGIPREHIERIFERFYRVDRARSREMGGTGLGLAIVKHLARAHGGEVSVQSETNQGSTFTIDLPAEITQRR